MFRRFFITVSLLLAIFLVPWWLSVPALLAGTIFIRRYIEGCVLACIFDLTYAGTPLFDVVGIVTMVTVFLFLVTTYIILPRLRHDVFSAS